MSLTSINFREAKIEDLSHLRTLEQCVVEAERPFNKNIKSGKPIYYDLETLISSKNSHVLVATNSEKIIATGYTDIRKSKPSLDHEYHAYIGFIFLETDYRGQGIIQELIQKLIEWSQSKGIKTFYLDVYSENMAAIKAYEKLGFRSSMTEMKLSL
jgi:ribosomal protein S18 acetylase RimI-like enzyme